MQNMTWVIEFIHIYREDNEVVDYLASIAHKIPITMYNYPTSNSLLAYCVNIDGL
ncbi:hypothetical protein LINPERPRIM_LOCUS3142 [Linum perenne]